MFKLLKKFAPHIALLGYIACAVFGGVAFYAWRAERDNRIRLDATLKAQQQVIDAQAATIKASEQRIAARDAALAQTVAALEKIKAQRPATPEATAQQIAQYMHLPSVPAVVVQAPVPDVPTVETPGPRLVFTPAEAEALRKAAVECEECRHELVACRGDAIDMGGKITALQTQNKTLTQQRDAAVKAVKGGGFWHRLWGDAKHVGIGIVIGGATVAAILR
jgi:hypothetical protein